MDENKYNQLDEVPLANIDETELKQIKQLEQQMGDKYVLIALKKSP